MPVKDFAGPPPRDPRDETIFWQIMTRVRPDLNWWPRWRGGGGDAAAAVVPGSPTRGSGGAEATPSD